MIRLRRGCHHFPENVRFDPVNVSIASKEKILAVISDVGTELMSARVDTLAHIHGSRPGSINLETDI